MCDFFWQRVETADQGDLADIVRASGGGRTSAAASNPSDPPAPGMDHSWQQQQQQLLHSDQPAVSAAAFPPLPLVDSSFFGSLRDPLLHELAAGSSTGGFFDGPTEGASRGCGGGDILLTDVELMKSRPSCSNLFSRVLQISPNRKPSHLSLGGGAIKPPAPPSAAVADHPMQISSPRGAPGIKRRKSQAKKVVCIPAPAAASNRTSGEVVPSDLWAWRKYGQKPIKGSPYPRGYYRCSSSKGCSARKQVERSRTDPNMLVITYTSEHNHPWPTQRNALAGSTRSQPTKSGGAASASKTSGSQNQRMPSPCSIKEEPKESTSTMTTTTGSSLARMKEETDGGDMDKAAGVEAPLLDDQAFDQMFYNEPAMDHGTLDQPNDFFADLAELDPDPMSLIFSRTDHSEEEEEEEKDKRKSLDSFIDIFDWGGSSFGDHQAKKGL